MHGFGKIPHAAKERGGAKGESFAGGYQPVTCSYSMLSFDRELESFPNDLETRKRFGGALLFLCIRQCSCGSPLKVFFLSMA